MTDKRRNLADDLMEGGCKDYFYVSSGTSNLERGQAYSVSRIHLGSGGGPVARVDVYASDGRLESKSVHYLNHILLDTRASSDIVNRILAQRKNESLTPANEG